MLKFDDAFVGKKHDKFDENIKERHLVFDER